MTAIATLPVLLGTGDHASRPAATDVGSGGLYSCTTHSLVYQTDGATWTTWATLGGSSDLDAIIAASAGQDIADALAGAAAPDAGNVFATMADVGGGSTIAYPSLKPGSPTDDFTSTLSGWTAASTAGSFTTATCLSQALDGSHLWMSAYSQNGFIYQSASNVDQEWIVGGLRTHGRWGDAFIGIALLDTSNNGVGLIYHQSDNTCAIIAVAAGIYTGSPAAHTTATAWGNGMGWDTRMWFRLARAGNVFTAYASVDGVNWNESTATITSAFTVARKAIGSFGIDAAGKIFQMSADWVNTV